MSKERHRWWLSSLDTIICCLSLSKKIWFQWLSWIENSSSNDFRTLPPSKDALFQHLLRASYQSGWVWRNSLLQEAPPQKESRGWRIHRGNLKFSWKTIDCYDKLVKLAGVCQCRSNKCLNCKCVKNNIKWLIFCNCSQKCHNIWFWLQSIWKFRN